MSEDIVTHLVHHMSARVRPPPNHVFSVLLVAFSNLDDYLTEEIPV